MIKPHGIGWDDLIKWGTLVTFISIHWFIHIQSKAMVIRNTEPIDQSGNENTENKHFSWGVGCCGDKTLFCCGGLVWFDLIKKKKHFSWGWWWVVEMC